MLLAVAAFVVFGRAVTGESSGSDTPHGKKATAELRDAANIKIGKVQLKQDGDSVEIKVEVDQGVAAGFHGFHIHAAGVCAAPFTTALGHYNPTTATHRNHAGDLPVLLIDGGGEAEARFSTDRFALGDLFDDNGSAFILHANADNYANIPTDRYDPDPDETTLGTGDAGARIACGVIEAK
jgi:Cu-Zn family superoxide dismutase